MVIFLLLAASAANYYISNPDISLPRKQFLEFPKILGDWTAVSDGKMDENSMRILKVDDYMIRSYRNSKGDFISLYIGYFQAQREGKGSHSPRQCLPGSGWNPIDATVFDLPLRDHNPNSLPVNKYIMGKGLDRQLYLFWYEGRGRAYASEYLNRFYLIWDSLTRKRTDGALIRVNGAVQGEAAEALKKQSDFINLFYPILKDYIPD